MQEAILHHLSNLIQYRTTNDNSHQIRECFKYIHSALTFYPFIVREYMVKYEEDGAKKSSLSYVYLTEETLHPKVILYAHIDVVPASQELFKMQVTEDGKAIGRGVYDMKFAVAVYIEVLRRLFENQSVLPSLAVFLTSDEETGGQYGTKYLLEQEGYRADVVIMPDGGKDWKIVKEAKGLLYAEIEATGQTAHSSRPWQGKSAIDTVLQIANEIRAVYPHPVLDQERWQTTVNFSRISGGEETSINQVADQAKLYLDIRYPWGETPREKLGNIVKVFSNAKIRFPIQKDAFFLDTDNIYVQNWKRLIECCSEGIVFVKEYGTADHHYFSTLGIPVILSQPKGGYIHTEKEEIDIKSLSKYTEVMLDFLNLINIG